MKKEKIGSVILMCTVVMREREISGLQVLSPQQWKLSSAQKLNVES